MRRLPWQRAHARSEKFVQSTFLQSLIGSLPMRPRKLLSQSEIMIKGVCPSVPPHSIATLYLYALLKNGLDICANFYLRFLFCSKTWFSLHFVVKTHLRARMISLTLIIWQLTIETTDTALSPHDTVQNVLSDRRYSPIAQLHCTYVCRMTQTSQTPFL